MTSKIGQRWRTWLTTRKLPEGKIAHPTLRNKAAVKAAKKSAQEREQEAIIKRRRREIAAETARLDRQEARLASRQHRADEAAQWQFEREMEDYVKGLTHPRR